MLVFARGADLALWVIDATAGAPGVWTALDGILTSAPAPVSHEPWALRGVRARTRSCRLVPTVGRRDVVGVGHPQGTACNASGGSFDRRGPHRCRGTDDAGTLIHRKIRRQRHGATGAISAAN